MDINNNTSLNFSFDDFVDAANDELRKDVILGSGTQIKIEDNAKPPAGEAQNAENVNGEAPADRNAQVPAKGTESKVSLSGNSSPRLLSAGKDKGTVGYYVSTYVERSLGLDWFTRTADQKKLNNEIRGIFLKAVKQELESRGVRGVTLKNLPQEIKDALKLSKFGFNDFGLSEDAGWDDAITTGKPLTARRIIEVKKAIDQVYGSNQKSDVKDTSAVLVGFFSGRTTMASNQANQSDRKRVVSDMLKLFDAARELSEKMQAMRSNLNGIRMVPSAEVEIRGVRAKLEYVHGGKDDKEKSLKLIATINGQSVDVPGDVEGLLYRMESEVSLNVAFYGKKMVGEMMGYVEHDSKPLDDVAGKNPTLVTLERVVSRWSPMEMSRKSRFYQNMIKSVLGEETFKAIPFSKLSLLSLRHVAITAMNGGYAKKSAVKALMNEVKGIGGKEDVINSTLVRQLCDQMAQEDIASIGKRVTVAQPTKKEPELTPEQQEKHDKAVKMHKFLGELVQTGDTLKLDKEGGALTDEMLVDMMLDNPEAVDMMLTDDTAFDSFDYEKNLGHKDDLDKGEQQTVQEQPVKEPAGEKTGVVEEKAVEVKQEPVPQKDEEAPKEDKVVDGPKQEPDQHPSPEVKVEEAEEVVKVEAPKGYSEDDQKLINYVDSLCNEVKDKFKQVTEPWNEKKVPAQTVPEQQPGGDEGQVVVDHQPVGEVPRQEAVGQEVPAPEQQVNEASGQENPIEEAPVKEEQVEGGKKDETQVKAEESPVQQPPVGGEQVPVEEQPVDKEPTADKSVKGQLKSVVKDLKKGPLTLLTGLGFKTETVLRAVKFYRTNVKGFEATTNQDVNAAKDELNDAKVRQQGLTSQADQLKADISTAEKSIKDPDHSVLQAKCRAILKAYPDRKDISPLIKNGAEGKFGFAFVWNTIKDQTGKAVAHLWTDEIGNSAGYKADLQKIDDDNAAAKQKIERLKAQLKEVEDKLSKEAETISRCEARINLDPSVGEIIKALKTNLASRMIALTGQLPDANDPVAVLKFLDDKLVQATKGRAEDLRNNIDNAIDSAMASVKDVMIDAVMRAFDIENIDEVLGEAGSEGAENASLKSKPAWQMTLDDLAGGDGISPKSGLGKFMLQSLILYYENVSDVDKRAMVASLIKNTDENSTPGQILGALLKGAGPVMQKMMQGLPTKGMPKDLVTALADMKDSLAPIPEEIVKAQLLAMVKDSNGKIESITVKKSLGAASVGQVFLCEMKLPGKVKPEKCAIKLLRPDVQNRVQRERVFFEKLASKIPGMSTTFAGDLSTILDELDLTIEARNIEQGRIYHQNPNMNIKSVEIHPLVAPSSNALVLKFVEGEPLSRELKKINERIEEILKETKGVSGAGIEGHYAKDPNRLIELRSELVGLYKELYEINDLLYELSKKWSSEAIFKGGFFHGDMHAGNLMVQKVGEGDAAHYELTVLDYGNSTQLSDVEQTSVIKLLLASTGRNTDVFMESFNAMMTPEGQKAFKKNWNKLKPEINRVLNMGVAGDSGQRMLAVIMLVQKFGIEIPPAFYKFIKSQIRLLNSIDSTHEQMRSVMAAIDQLGLSFPAAGEPGNRYGEFSVMEEIGSCLRASTSDDRITAAIGCANSFLNDGKDVSGSFLGKFHQFINGEKEFFFRENEYDVKGRQKSARVDFDDYIKGFLDSLGQKGDDPESLSYKAHTAYEKYRAALSVADGKVRKDKELVSLIKDGETVRAAYVRLRKQLKSDESDIRAKVTYLEGRMDKIRELENGTDKNQRKLDRIEAIKKEVEGVKEALDKLRKSTEAIRNPVQRLKDILDFEVNENTGPSVFSAGSELALSLRDWQRQSVTKVLDDLRNAKKNGLKEGSSFFDAFTDTVMTHTGDALQRLGYITGGRLAKASAAVGDEELDDQKEAARIYDEVFLHTENGFSGGTNSPLNGQHMSVLGGMAKQFVFPPELKGVIESGDIYKSQEKRKVLLETLKLNMIEYSSRLREMRYDSLDCYQLSKTDRWFDQQNVGQPTKQVASAHQELSSQLTRLKGSLNEGKDIDIGSGTKIKPTDEVKEQLVEKLTKQILDLNNVKQDRDTLINNHKESVLKRYTYVGSLLYTVSAEKGGRCPGLLQSMRGISSLDEYQMVMAEIDAIPEDEFGEADAQIIRQMMKDCISYAQSIRKEENIAFKDLMNFGGNCLIDKIGGIPKNVIDEPKPVES